MPYISKLFLTFFPVRGTQGNHGMNVEVPLTLYKTELFKHSQN